MLNFHDEFTIFDSNIKLTEPRKDQIRSSRNAVREKIRTHYVDDLEVSSPKFTSQGSFIIHTALNPLPDEEVDADDGVYITHVGEDRDSWPSPSSVHNDIVDALEDHTQDGCESKTSCVRVQYRNFYHLDLPVYIMDGEEALLGQTSNDKWIKSDSKAFKDWFYENRTEIQNTRIIRYLKAWRDFTNAPFTSIGLTIEGINCFSGDEGNDHLSLLDTVECIYEKLEKSRSIFKPVSPFEDLWASNSSGEVDEKIDRLRIFADDLRTALNSDSYSKASTIFRELFGDRFPWKKDKAENKSEEFSTGAKPWGTL